MRMGRMFPKLVALCVVLLLAAPGFAAVPRAAAKCPVCDHCVPKASVGGMKQCCEMQPVGDLPVMVAIKVSGATVSAVAARDGVDVVAASVVRTDADAAAPMRLRNVTVMQV